MNDSKENESGGEQEQEPEHTNLSPISSSSSSGVCSASSSDFIKKTKKQSRFSMDAGSCCSRSFHDDNSNNNKIIIIDNDSDNERDIDSEFYGKFKKKDKDSWNNNHKNSSMARKMNRMSSSSIDRLESTRHHTKMTNNRKHISLDDDIVQIESDSSLMVAGGCRRRNNAHFRSSYAGMGYEDGARSGPPTVSFSKDNNCEKISQHTQIVSILKRKDSSTSSNTSLVTFSPNVIDTKSTTRQGILKKRSSLDESRYIRRRSHSPSSASSADEKGCLKNSRRRNSFEETNHQGILKQKSYDSSSATSGFNTNGSSGGCNSPNTSTVHGILKKPSSSTPSESHYQVSDSHATSKHVSISEAVILAAAELCKSMIIIDDNDKEHKPKPILKPDHDHIKCNKIKPILKKNHSSETETEIKSILKTSRKSSREESFYSDS